MNMQVGQGSDTDVAKSKTLTGVSGRGGGGYLVKFFLGMQFCRWHLVTPNPF